MPEPMTSLFHQLSKNFRIADFFDIALVSVFFYTAITWFRETTSRPAVLGIVFLTLLYFLSRTFDMVLTSIIFQAVFAVLVVAGVVVFQEEIRRLFERIATWGTFQGKRQRVSFFSGIDTLVEAASTLASNKAGALIVLKGRDPLDRHIAGGIPLYGRISNPLFYSIFDPHSPGHDGAVLIEADRISKFAVHLPLSKNQQPLEFQGTRHTAALGLAERTDAFVIVISEERGTISVAQQGRIKTMESAAELKGRLEDFIQHKFPRKGEKAFQRLVRQNVRIKVLSVALASLSWIVFAYHAGTVQRTFVIPIEYRNIPSGWLLEEPKPVEAQVTLTGSERAFQLLNPNSLIISLDLSKLREGTQQIFVSEEDLRHPSNLSLYRIEPNLIALKAHHPRFSAETIQTTP